jgi:hypothetical protein
MKSYFFCIFNNIFLYLSHVDLRTCCRAKGAIIVILISNLSSKGRPEENVVVLLLLLRNKDETSKSNNESDAEEEARNSCANVGSRGGSKKPQRLGEQADLSD